MIVIIIWFCLHARIVTSVLELPPLFIFAVSSSAALAIALLPVSGQEDLSRQNDSACNRSGISWAPVLAQHYRS